MYSGGEESVEGEGLDRQKPSSSGAGGSANYSERVALD